MKMMKNMRLISWTYTLYNPIKKKQGRKRPLDTPKRMIREIERERER